MIPLRDDNPTRTVPIVTVGLLIANVLVFLYQLTLPQDALRAFVYQLGVVPSELTLGPRYAHEIPVPLTLVTSMFLHGGVLHLAGNMLWLWVFGDNVEDAAGHFRFLVFYMLCGLAAAGAQILSSPQSDVPMIGASGAISGVLGAYMLLFPHARVLTLIPILIFIRLVYLPAILLLGLYFLMQLALTGSAGAAGGGGVAVFAHIGGFIAGMVLIWFFRRPRQVRIARRAPDSIADQDDV